MVRVKITASNGNEVKLGQLKHHVFIVLLQNKWDLTYRAFCGGSIITEQRVLSSTHCFYTNQKRPKRNIRQVKVVGGILKTIAKHAVNPSIEQWREIKHIYTQKYFRFPAYNLAVIELDEPWVFTQFVNKIPFASQDHDFDGICQIASVRPTRSWSKSKTLFTEDYKMIPRRNCERIILRNLRLYYCTKYDETKMSVSGFDSEGGGLICHGTGDPMEADESQGILVGVVSVIPIHLPVLHHKIGIFHKWVTDAGKRLGPNLLTWPLIICLVY